MVGGWTGGRDVVWYNDFDIVSTFLSALASTDAVTPVLARVVVITLRDVSC